MRLDVFLRADSASDTIKFYVDELGLFRVDADYGMDSFLLRALHNPALCLQITSWHPEPDKLPRFGLSVTDCMAEFKRMSRLTFASGGFIVPDKTGSIGVFEWPGGKNFMLEDPSHNRFLLFEDFIAPA